MKWKFWKKDTTKDETVVQVTNTSSTGGTAVQLDIYVKASTSQKALELYDTLKEREQKH